MAEINQISDSLFRMFIEFIERKTGMAALEANHRTIKESIALRSLKLNIQPLDYLYLINNDMDEYQFFLDTVTINETYFFREEKHFKVIEKHIFPSFFREFNKIKLWSATCSTGEEAISLTLLANKYWNKSENRDFSVFATDINTTSLEKFTDNKYNKNSFRKDGSSFHYLLDQEGERNDKEWSLNTKLLSKIKIMKKNLLINSLDDISDNVNIIFLRNTLLYMGMPIKEKIISRVVEKLHQNGFIFLSSSEIPLINNDMLEINQFDGTYFIQKRKHKQTFVQKDACDKKNVPVSEKNPSSSRKDIWEKPSPKREVELNTILEIAKNKSRDRKFEFNKIDNEHIIADLLIATRDLINKMEFEYARNIIVECKRNNFSNEITFFLTALSELMENKSEEAISFFRKSIYCNVNFWPAYFYLGQIFTKIDYKNAYKNMKICIEKIRLEIDRNENKYSFLMDDFSQPYFIGICEKRIDLIEKKYPDVMRSF